jgi:hypothetical protein
MKKLNGYNEILEDVLRKFKHLDVTILTINDKYANSLVDKNKDDFLCQYLFYEMQQRYNCTLISNDKYRDKEFYINLFDFDMNITFIKWNSVSECIDSTSTQFVINKAFLRHLVSQTCKRCTIPKHNLHKIIK